MCSFLKGRIEENRNWRELSLVKLILKKEKKNQWKTLPFLFSVPPMQFGRQKYLPRYFEPLNPLMVPTRPFARVSLSNLLGIIYFQVVS
jgi:hypothetical protein